MKHSKLFGNMLQRPLLIAVVATFAAACATGAREIRSETR
jgi:hypothetical protein